MQCYYMKSDLKIVLVTPNMLKSLSFAGKNNIYSR